MELIAWAQETFPDRHVYVKGASVYVEGHRESVVIFTKTPGGGVRFWAGKSDSESGGLAGSCGVEGDVIGMLQRFIASGRRKVLTRWKQR